MALTTAAQAGNYSALVTTMDGLPVVRLLDAERRIEVSIAVTIGNNAYEMKVNGANVFWHPTESLAEWRAKPRLSGNPFMAPWANRLDQDAFFANGKRYLLNDSLGNLRRDGNKLPIHGLLLSSSLWEVASIEADDGSARVTSRLDFWKFPDLMAQFPFAHAIEMSYILQDGRLEVVTRLENRSAEPMPVAVGYHPYFQVHDAPRDQWKVHVGAREQVVLSKLLVPTGERKPLGLPDPVLLRDTPLDDVFANLIRDGQGRAEFWLEGARQRVSVLFGPKYTIGIVYAPPNSNFVAIEPMSAVTNGLNLHHAGAYPELQSIPPGGEWRESFWVVPAGF
jgi:aldose 1-epimerase